MADSREKLDEVESNETSLEKVKRYVSQYDGYINSENGFELDRIFRQQLANKLEENQTKLNDTLIKFSEEGTVLSSSGLDKIEGLLQDAIAKTLSSEVEYEDHLGSADKDSKKLNDLCSVDADIVTHAENISIVFDQVHNTALENNGVEEFTTKLSEMLNEFISLLDTREEIINSFPS